MYSFFDGVYVQDPIRTHQGRPIYIEQKKSDRTPFDAITPTYDPYHPGVVVSPFSCMFSHIVGIIFLELIKSSAVQRLNMILLNLLKLNTVMAIGSSHTILFASLQGMMR